MSGISSGKIYEAVKKAWVEIAFELPEDIIQRLAEARRKETATHAKEVLSLILENAETARRKRIPLCQDTGFPAIFIERGEETSIEGENIQKTVEKAVSDGTREACLRPSIVAGPFFRHNTGGNTPPVVSWETAPGNGFRMTVSAKGAGSENAGLLALLKPGAGRDGVKKTVAEHVRKYAANACPPLVIGVGIGGTADKAALMAKKACLRRIDASNPPEKDFEEEMLDEINSSGIGPGGFGGRFTALAVNVETFACHIASLPVAVSINCHAVRRKEILL